MGGLLTGNLINSNVQYSLGGLRFAARIGNNRILLGPPNAPLVLGDNANVGIGTENPSSSIGNSRVLDITGQSAVLKLSSSQAGGNVFEWQSGVFGPSAGLNLRNNSTSSNALTVLSNGNIGIGTMQPTAAIVNSRVLDIEGANTTALRLGTTNQVWEFQNAFLNGNQALSFSSVSTLTNPLTLLANGNVGISNTSPTAKLHVDGKIKLTVLGGGGTTQLCRNSADEISNCSSSLRYKTDLKPFMGGLNVVNRLHPLTFKWKSDNSLDLVSVPRTSLLLNHYSPCATLRVWLKALSTTGWVLSSSTPSRSSKLKLNCCGSAMTN